jgi:hypothetical protein
MVDDGRAQDDFIHSFIIVTIIAIAVHHRHHRTLFMPH